MKSLDGHCALSVDVHCARSFIYPTFTLKAQLFYSAVSVRPRSKFFCI